MKKTKKMYTDEILRFCRTLTQMKYDSEEDKMFKKLIAENLAALSRLAEEEAQKRAERKEQNEIAKHRACF